MAKYNNFDQDKYRKTFDNMFGQGSYEQGQQSARSIGQAKANADIARKEYAARKREEEKAAKAKAKEDAKKAALDAANPLADSKIKEDKKTAKKEGGGFLDSLVSGAKKVGSEISRFDNKMQSAMTFGLSDELAKSTQKKLDKKGIDANITKHLEPRKDGNIVGKGADMLAELAGMTVTGVGAVGALRGAGLTGKGLGALNKAHKTNTVTKPILKRAAVDSAKEGAIVGGGLAAADGAVRLGLNDESNTTWKDEAKNVALNAALGGVLDPLVTLAAPLAKMGTRNMVDKAVSSNASRRVSDGLAEASSNPERAVDLVREQMRQGSTIQGIANRTDSERVMNMLINNQNKAPREAGAINIGNQRADDARQIMNSLSESNARKLTNVDPEESLNILLGRERQKLANSQMNRDVPTSVEPKVNQSDSASFPRETSDPFNVLARPRQTSNFLDDVAATTNPNVNQTFIDRTVHAPKKDARSAVTKAQESFTNDLASIRQIDETMKTLDADGLMNYLNPKTTIGARQKSLAADSSLEKSLMNAKGAHSVSANHVTSRYSPFLESINKSKTVNVEDLGEYAFAKHGMNLLENSADSKALRDGMIEDIDALKSSLGANSDEVKAMEELLDGYTTYQMPEGATPDVLQAKINQFESNPEMVQQYENFMKLQQDNLKDMFDGGMITKDLYEKLAANKTYISMHRNFDTGAQTMTGTASRRPQTPLDTMGQGSSVKIKDPISEAIRNAYITKFNIEKNNALKVVEKFAAMDKGEGVFKGVLQPNANTITVFKNGKPKNYEVPTALKSYVDNFNADSDPDMITNMLQGLAQMQRKLTTQYNLSFQLKSLVREPVQAIVVSRTAKNSLQATKNVALGYVDTLMGKQLQELTKDLPKALQFKSFKENWDKMGGTGFQYIRMSDDDLQRVSKEMMEGGTAKGNIKKLNPFRALGKFGEKVEEGARLGEFRSAKNQGYSDADAFYEATDLTNYKRSGNSTRVANKYMPFLNATIQGNSRVARAFQEAPAKTITRGVTALTTTSAAIYGMRYMDGVSDEQRQELENLSQWEKDSYLHVPVPFEGNDTIIALPKAFAVGQMFMNPMERALDDYYNRVMKEESVPDHIKEGIKTTAKAFVPPYEVAGATTAYELMQNKSLFTKQEIESQYDIDGGVDKRDREAYNQSYLTKVLSDAINAMTFDPEGAGVISPAQVDYIVKDLTGSAGTHALEISDIARPDNAPTKTWQDQLLKPVKQFTADPTRASGVYKELQSLASNEKKGNTSMQGMTDEERITEITNRPAQNIEDMFKEINKEIQAVRSDSSLSAQEKKDMLIALRKKQDSIGSQSINWYNSIK